MQSRSDPSSRPAPEAEVQVQSTGDPVTRPPRAGAVDTHCHLFLMEQDSASVIASAAAAAVDRLVCVGIDPESSRRSLELAESFRGVFSTAGMHPHTASAFDRQTGSRIEELLGHPMVVGIGETGLDYYRRLSPVEDQVAAFRTHIALSRETGKPLVVHVRDAWPDAMDLLREERAERVVLHCFSGDEAVAEEAQARGYFLSFAGNITYPNADGLRRAASAAGDGRVIAETDSPYLPPQSLRGRENSPANVVAVLSFLAEIRGVNVDEMFDSSTRAARQAFPLLR